MKELVIKRQANVTSADALDEINAAYPNAEVLSFRRVRDAASEADLFVTRIRVAADDMIQMEAPEDEVVVEGRQHEEEEEAMMKEMLTLLHEVKNIVSDEEGSDEELKSEKPERIETEEELERKHKAKPLPEPSEAPYGAAGFGHMAPVASLVVQRPATISKTAARLELIREFSDEYRVGKIEKRDGMFVVSLYKDDIAKQMLEVQNAITTRIDPQTGKELSPGKIDGLKTKLIHLQRKYQEAESAPATPSVAETPVADTSGEAPVAPPSDENPLIDEGDLERYEELVPEETEVPVSEEAAPQARQWPWLDESQGMTKVIPWAAVQQDGKNVDWSKWEGISEALRDSDYITNRLLTPPEYLRGRQKVRKITPRPDNTRL